MTVHELRSRLIAAKKARRIQIAALPILEKFRVMERMKEDADPIRAYRKLQMDRPPPDLNADSPRRD